MTKMSSDERLLLARATRRLRMERGMSFREAGKLFGLDASNVFRAEAGTRRPLPAAQIAEAFGVSEHEVRRPCPRCGYAPPAGFTCNRCGTEGSEQPDSRTEVRYLMEGTLGDKSWAPFSSEMDTSEPQAIEVYDSWRASRDRGGLEFRYRLLKRITTVQVLASEEEVTP